MAAMIVMIVVYAAPTAVQAHEGHAHHGPHHAVVEQKQVAPPAVVKAADGKTFASMPSTLHEPTQWVADLQGLTTERVASLRTAQDGMGSCPGDAGVPCCGKKACCSPGILSGPAELPIIPFRQSSVSPGDMNGRLGAGPGALPEPPRTLA
ncbi:hypothetical protein [Methylobacterium sp. Leaf108]|nr:hypothetical protein [Methylobacterium sp. Leaf108]